MVDADVQKIIKSEKLDGMLFIKGNCFMGENPVGGRDVIRDRIGYHGDSGLLLVTRTENILFVPARDSLQAKIDMKGKKVAIKPFPFSDFLRAGKKRLRIGYDPLEHTKDRIDTWQKDAEMVKVDRPVKPLSGKEENMPQAYAGKSSREKIKKITEKMTGKYLLICDPMDLGWLLNKRGDGNPYIPFPAAFGLLSEKGTVETFKDIGKLKNRLKKIESKIEMDPEYVSAGIEECIRNPVRKASVIAQEKWVKNETERKHIGKIAKVEDKVIRKCLSELKEGLSENDIVMRLKELRKAEKTYRSDSFQTIAAFGKNAAVIHYRPKEQKSAKLRKNQIVLIDTGGQYLKGTTDVTATVCFGTPTQKQRKMYTAVLKAHIAYATLVFPEGSSVLRLDPIVRSVMWQNGMDYPHGTSHGIGFYGDVHEGGAAFSKTPLKEGMILSNEPGYYEEGAFGIRIENMMEVVRKGRFLGFKLLTHVPLDEKLIIREKLSPAEKNWLRAYPK